MLYSIKHFKKFFFVLITDSCSIISNLNFYKIFMLKGFNTNH